AVLCAARLRLQLADWLWRPAGVRTRGVPRHRRLRLRPCAEGVGVVARAWHPGRRRRGGSARPRHRLHFDPSTGHLLLDDHAGAVAAAVFHLSAGAVHAWRGWHPGHSAGNLFGMFDLSKPTVLYYVVLGGFLA